MKKTLLILTALLALTGCGTVVKLIDPSEKYIPYAGAAYDLEMAQKWGLPILDLPLSFFIRYRIVALCVVKLICIKI